MKRICYRYLTAPLLKMRLGLLGLTLLLVGGMPAHAVLTIEITEGVEGALPIAVVPFAWEQLTSAPVDLSGIISADLRRSGRFKPLAAEDMISRPSSAEDINFLDWRMLGMDHLVIGKLNQSGPDQYVIEFQLFDVLRAGQLAGFSVPVRGAQLRRAAHHISDLIYKTLTGERGAFDTRIAYVTAGTDALGNKEYQLQVADSDGYGPQTVLSSRQPIMSPAWAPDGRRLAYVSFEQERAEVFVQDTASGQRAMVASFEGINGAPAWSPDGTRLALTLSQDGNPEIYILNLLDGSSRRVTSNPAIDTEASWSPDGESLVFTSDRGGGPQLYRVSSSGGRAERLTYEGGYNASGEFSPDGKRLAFVHRTQDGAYRVAVMDLANRRLRVISDGRLDESPSFAPNGSMVIYATEARGRGVLAAVSVDGRAGQRLSFQAGDVREPVWSPFLSAAR